MRVIITGGTGELGQLLQNRFNNKGIEYVSLGRIGHSSYSLEGGFKNIRIQKTDVILHLAYDFEDLYKSQPRDINKKGAQELLRTLQEIGIQKAILISSDSAAHPMNSTYGADKLQLEEIWLSMEDTLVLRVGLLTGDGALGPYAKLKKLFNKIPLRVIPNGNSKLFVRTHVEDLVEEILLYFTEQNIVRKKTITRDVERISLIEALRGDLKHYGIYVSIPVNVISFPLKALIKIAPKYRRINDSLQILKSTGAELDSSEKGSG